MRVLATLPRGTGIHAGVGFFTAIGCALLAGCGYIGEPLYPALNIPERVTNLSAVQRGGKIDIAFTIPPLTTEGLAIKSIGSVDLRIGPDPTPGNFQTNAWAASAKHIEVETPAQPGLVRKEVPIEDFIGKEVIIGVRVGNAKGRFSDWSNWNTISVRPPLATPSNLSAKPIAEGVRLQWNATGEPKFRIFRREEKEDKPTQIAEVDSPEYVDKTTEYGKTYRYYVQGLNEQAQSEVAGPESVTPKDIFPPATPSAVTASVGINTVELAWERNTEPDFKEYRVYRSVDGGPFDKIADSLVAPSYSDSKIEPGKRYRYQIAAVDESGNPSPPSAAVEAIVP